MIRYLLDTNICVFHLRGQLNLNDSVNGNWKECCCISEVTVLELYYGAAKGNNPSKHYAAVEVFLRNLSIIHVSDCVSIYATEKVRLMRLGTPLHDEFDLIIGSSAITKNLILVTDNVKHFKRFEGIKIENWFKHL